MLVLAAKRGSKSSAFYDVRSNVFGALHIADSIRVYQGGRLVDRHRTVSDFRDAWDIMDAATHEIRLIGLKRTHGLGDIVRFFAECFPLWVKRWFHGCEDRRWWLNTLLVFSPTRGLSPVGRRWTSDTWPYSYRYGGGCGDGGFLSWWDNTTLAKNIKRIGQKGLRK